MSTDTQHSHSNEQQQQTDPVVIEVRVLPNREPT